jgi:L-lactate dehydrogenase
MRVNISSCLPQENEERRSLTTLPLFAMRCGVSSANLHAYVIGEHGDSQLPAFSSARIAGFPLDEFCVQLGLPQDQVVLQKIANETRNAGSEIVEAKGATYYGIGAALVRIIRAILQDEHAILAVSSRVPESLGLGDVSLSLPSIVDRNGVARVLSVPLSSCERKALEASAEVIKRGIAVLFETEPM